MKTTVIKVVGYVLTCMLLLGTIPAEARKDDRYISVSGVVKDKQTKKTLEAVNISVPGTSIGTVTNAEGFFTIKVTDSIHARSLEVSYLGYLSEIIPLVGKDVEGVTVLLTPNVSSLPEVVIRAMDPVLLVRQALEKVAVNNPNKPHLLMGFYRETIQKRRSYINVTEAVINIYKTAYTEDVTHDKVQVYKGRQLVSPKRGDTLLVKLQGGPNYAIYMDVVKNKEIFLDEQSFRDYKFRMNGSVMLNDRSNYVVSFEPHLVQPYPLFYGKLYIDEQTLTFTQAEFSYNMKDRNKITNMILRRKPHNLRFKPEELTYLVTYRQEDGVTYLNYIRNEIRFKCDWSRRLFSTTYTILSEMVVTDKTLKEVKAIHYRDAFKFRSILSDRVNSFYDEDFWEGYNIIAPTESLESAVGKLMKKYK